jgi:signal transduction histidine kinase
VERLGYIKDYEVRLKRKNGNPLTGLITAAVIYDDKGAAAGYRGILRDVTLQRQLEEQLRHAQKMEAVGQLTGGIAHDFNNILTAIIGFAYVLQSRLEEDSPLRSHAEVILASAEKAASLAQGLLAFSSRQVSNPKPVPLNDTVHRIRTLLLNLTGEHIRIGLNMSEENPVIMADSGQMDQVLMNLAVNARDAMPGGGMLSIETGVAELDTSFIAANGFGTSGRFALLKVSDTGSGMDEETLKRIFEPFFTTKEVGKGTGLGLSIIYGIVKQHKGYITVSSEPGRGTTFKIYLPLAEEKDLLQQNDEQAPDEQGTETILLAEDDRDLRLLMRTVLSELGYTLIDAVDGEDAIAKFREYRDRIDLLLFDVIMPKKNGREVYDEIKTMQPDVKVLFTSAYPAEIVEKRGVLDDGLPFVPKPVTPAVLLKRIREVLDAGSSR